MPYLTLVRSSFSLLALSMYVHFFAHIAIFFNPHSDLSSTQIRLSVGPPLVLRVTHPKILLLLGYLVSSVAKRDPVGRKPKRKLFAVMGTKKYEQDLNKEVRREFCSFPYIGPLVYNWANF